MKSYGLNLTLLCGYGKPAKVLVWLIKNNTNSDKKVPTFILKTFYIIDRLQERMF
jgi:hypothetical protein